jgi:hypothetical protein
MILTAAFALPAPAGPPVEITAAPPEFTSDATPTFEFRSSDLLARFECRLGEAAPAACSSPHTLDLADGTYTFTVVAYDILNDPGEPQSRTFTVDTVKPVVTIDPVPSPTREVHIPFNFAANEPVARFDCTHVFPDASTQPYDDCQPGVMLRDLTDGTHGLRVVATDRAGNQSDPVTRQVTVDVTPPPPAAVTAAIGDRSATFTFEPTAGSARFECQLEGPGGPVTDSDCVSPKTYGNLAPGDYRFQLRTLDALGNGAESPAEVFTIAAPTPTPTATPTGTATPSPTPLATASATPTPTPTPPAAEPSPATQPSHATVTAKPAPRPEFRRTVVIRPVGGQVRLRRPGAAAFETLTGSQAIPLGSTIDTKRGRLKLASAPAEGAPAQQAEFYGGIFLVSQRGRMVDLRLTETLGACRTRSAPRSRRLWGAGKGAFRISGRYAVATARGGRWFVQDSCAGTLTRVTQGVVAVRSRSAGRTFLVRKGKRHLARSRR